MSARVAVKDFGPFEEASLELKPLTLFIGRNSVGKSILTYLLWTLLTAEPDFDKLSEIIEGLGAGELANEVLKSVETGINPGEKFKNLVKIVFKAFPESIASGLRKAFQRVFLADLGELIRENADRATVLIEGGSAYIGT